MKVILPLVHLLLVLTSALAAPSSDARVIRTRNREGMVQEDILTPRAASDGECTLGAWRCQGQELQRCYNSQWNVVQTCDGTRTVCEASNPLLPAGCVFPSAGLPSGGGQLPSTSGAPVVNPSTSVQGGLPASSGARVGAPSVCTSLSPAPSTSAGPIGNSTGPSGAVSAPHYAIYHDRASRTLPASAADIKPWNRFLLAFWTSNAGAQDGAAELAQKDSGAIQAMVDDFHANGISLMVSAFGSTDFPTPRDPVATAQELAAWTKQYGLDGVDIDYEDSGSFLTGAAVTWLISFQKELRNQLPSPYIISHAPQAPYMGAGQWTASGGGYKAIHDAVGDSIDFYNVQFYNQMSIKYDTCDTLIKSSGDGTALMEVQKYTGIPLDKLVVGKPLNSEDVSNTGIMTAEALAPCISQLKSQDWNAGIMVWQWETGAAVDFLKTAAGL